MKRLILLSLLAGLLALAACTGSTEEEAAGGPLEYVPKVLASPPGR